MTCSSSEDVRPFTSRERTSALSSGLYRDVKGLTSSELEQVMLKATRPDNVPVKTKHVERLVGVTYQISGRYDIYDAVLRKLWNKMAEKDARTKIKSVYVLHRFSADGAPGHREALKQRLRALRKTKDPKGGRGARYFDSKVLIGAEDTNPENQAYRAFLSRYAHYVLTRTQTFGGVFEEISPSQPPTPAPKPSKKGRANKPAHDQPKGKPPLCEEHLKFSRMVLKAGLACALHDGEESESTAACCERVAADLMGLTAATAAALKHQLKKADRGGPEEDARVRRWCEFYARELLPDTKKFVKRASAKLDAYGMYLPSRMSASLSSELLERGLTAGDEEGDDGAREETAAEEEDGEDEDADTGADTDGTARADAVSAETDDDDGYDEEYYDDEYDEEDEY